eukprot:jgi/Mesvir1/28670/Mv21286-RA.1
MYRVIPRETAKKMYMVSREGRTHFRSRPRRAEKNGGTWIRMQRREGSYRQVYHGVAQKTPGGLTSADLTKNKRKHIVPIAKMEAGRDAYNRIEDWVGFSKRVHKMIGGDYKSALKMAKKLTDDYLRDANLPATAENKRKFWTEYVADHDLPDEDARISPVLEDDDGF